MSARRVLVAVVWAGVLAVILGVSSGDELRLSIDLWLATAAVGAVWVVIVDVIAAAKISTRKPRSLFSRRPPTSSLDARPRNLRALEGLVVAGTTQSRAHSHRLRPRLRPIAAHTLRVDHGIDLEAHPEAAREILGPAYWLLDEDTDERMPSLLHLEELLDRLRPTSPDTESTRLTSPAESAGSNQ